MDTLLVIPNQKLINNVDRKTSIPEAFSRANDVLSQAVQGISDSIIETGLINIDFADAETVLRDQGDALMAIGYGAGDNRVEEAVSGVLDNPLLEDTSIKGAKRALIYVAGSEDLPLVEYDDIVRRVTANMDKDAIIIPGMYLDSNLGDKIRVTLIASGSSAEAEPQKLHVVKSSKSEMISGDEYTDMLAAGGMRDVLPRRGNRDEHKYVNEDLDVPTVIRDRRFLNFSSPGMGQAQMN